MNPSHNSAPLQIHVTRGQLDYDSETSPAAAASTSAAAPVLSACDSVDRALLLEALEDNFEDLSDELLERIGAYASAPASPSSGPAADAPWLAECVLWILGPNASLFSDMNASFCERGLLPDCGGGPTKSAAPASESEPEPFWWALCLVLFPLSTAIGNLLVIASIARSSALRNTLTSW